MKGTSTCFQVKDYGESCADKTINDWDLNSVSRLGLSYNSWILDEGVVAFHSQCKWIRIGLFSATI